MEIVFILMVIGLLIIINAFYVAAEFSTVSVRKSRILQLANNNNKLAKKQYEILNDAEKLDDYVAACQIGITISSIVLGSYSQAKLPDKLLPLLTGLGQMQELAAQSLSAIIILLLLTALQVIIGELIPKSLALHNPVKTSLLLVVPMKWSLLVLKWFIVFLNGSGNLILKLFKTEHIGHGHIHSPEEIAILMSESVDVGLLKPEQYHRLRHALQLQMRTARQLMIPRSKISAIDIETPMRETIEFVSENPYTRMPVYSGTIDNIVGILHTKHLLNKYIEKGNSITITDIMTTPLIIPETITSDKILLVMRQERVQQAIVIDEFGGIEGLITLEDVLAEVMGQMSDEFKKSEPVPVNLPDGRIKLPGLTLLDEAKEFTGVLWEGRSDTVGGIVTENFGRLPNPGEHIIIEGIEVEVEKVKNRAVTSIIVRSILKKEDF